MCLIGYMPKYPTDTKGRYVRIPTPLKRDSNPMNLISIHKRSIEREKRKLGVTDYQLLWISFFRGALVAIILERLILH